MQFIIWFYGFSQHVSLCPFDDMVTQTFKQGHLGLDAPFTLGVGTNQHVDLLISCDDIVRVYL